MLSLLPLPPSDSVFAVVPVSHCYQNICDVEPQTSTTPQAAVPSSPALSCINHGIIFEDAESLGCDEYFAEYSPELWEESSDLEFSTVDSIESDRNLCSWPGSCIDGENDSARVACSVLPLSYEELMSESILPEVSYNETQLEEIVGRHALASNQSTSFPTTPDDIKRQAEREAATLIGSDTSLRKPRGVVPDFLRDDRYRDKRQRNNASAAKIRANVRKAKAEKLARYQKAINRNSVLRREVYDLEDTLKCLQRQLGQTRKQ